MLNTRTGALKMAEEFRSESDIKIKYTLDADYSELTEAYPIKEIAGDGDGFERAVRILKWMSQNIRHKGNYDNHIERRAKPLLDYAFGKEDCGINCSALSAALTEILFAIGIKARTVYIMPFSPYDFDNHVVTEAYSEAFGKWFMIDPTYGLYAVYNDIPQSILEIRALLANGKWESITFNEDAHYNGEPIEKRDVCEYYAKDMYWFQICSIQGNSDEEIKHLNIAPLGFDVKKFNLANVDFRIKECGEAEWLLEWRESIRKSDDYIYVSDEILK